MRRVVVLFLVALCLSISNLQAQDSIPYHARWITRPSFGTNIPFLKLLNGHHTDDLFQYDDHTVYFQFISIAYFFREHWGGEFSVRGATSSRIADRDVRFYNWVQKEYGEQYYLVSADEFVDFYTPFTGDVRQIMFGLVYRIQKDRWSLYPKLAIGGTAYETDMVTFYLKEKDANTTYKVTYLSDEYMPGGFTIAPSVSGSYQLTRRFAVQADVAFPFFRNSMSFQRTTTNLSTGEAVIDNFSYKRVVLAMSVGAGFTFVLDRFNR